MTRTRNLRAESGASWELDLRADEIKLVGSEPCDLCPGDGIRVEFRLGSGTPIAFNARVRETGLMTASGCCEAWIDFTDLSPVDRREFRRWQELMLAERDTARIAVTLRHKYRVRRRGAALSVWVEGRLEPGEAEALADAIIDSVKPGEFSSLALLLDIEGLEIASVESQSGISRWLLHLARYARPLGILAGHASASMVQFRRLLSEAGLADAFTRFDSSKDALPTWRTLVEEVSLRESAAWASKRCCA